HERATRRAAPRPARPGTARRPARGDHEGGGMSEQAQFTIRVDQNKYLPVGGTEVHAIVTVEATGPLETVAQHAQAAEVIIIDTSTSMATERIGEARKAAMAAIDTLRDGVHFAIIAGTTKATMVYPHRKEMATMNAE